MKLTAEQEEVVSITSGRHLVLAPPGSGKTEMLSQRIRKAIASGVDPKRMLCATFTNRAAFEMRERIGDGDAPALPDVGNLHHFCHRFLMSVGRLGPGRHVLDEVEQLEFAKEILDVLTDELRYGYSSAGKRHDVTVIRLVNVGDDEERRERMLEKVEAYLADCRKCGCSPYVDFLGGMLSAHQARIGIPARYRSPMPTTMYGLSGDGVLRAAAIAYTGLKRKFRSVDFNDLMNETFLYLMRKGIEEERRFLWVQVDEVQDLNPMQWYIVRELTAVGAVSVYFGDAEQAIFSFLGATTSSFAEATADCRRHFFRLNFRTTPVLLEVLMRYSIAALDSDWEFLPRPGADRGVESRLCLAGDASGASVAAHVCNLLSAGIAENIAVLVRTNREADAYEVLVKPLGYRLAKVSGHDLFSYSPMRDFLAFVSLFNSSTSMSGWACLFHRFADLPRNRATARHLVRVLEAGGWDLKSVVSDGGMFASLMSGRASRVVSRLRHVRALRALRRVLKPAFDNAERTSFRKLFEAFSVAAFGPRRRYSLYELLPGVKITDDMLADPEMYGKAVVGAKDRIERFLRYTDHVYASDARQFADILNEDLEKISKLKEADLLVGDEKIVISTIHKAKGRQFDAVIVPDVSEVLKATRGADASELRRLLYVAMSRAKRHLSLFGVDRSIPEIACMCKCFDPGYVSVYTGRDIARGKDWLWHWERLAEMNSQRRCELAKVEDSVTVGSVPVARMAIKCCRHIVDREAARARLFEVVRKALADYEGVSSDGDSAVSCWNWRSVDVEKSLLACRATAIDGLCRCGMFDGQVLNVVRRLAAYDRDHEVLQSAFGYVKDAATDSNGAREAVGDFLYSCLPHLRLAAASALEELGDDRWVGLISGVARDFENLSTVADASHEATIRRILSVPKFDSYDRRLRNLLHRRAMKFGI